MYIDPKVVNSPHLVYNQSVNHDNLLRQGLIAYRVGDLHKCIHLLLVDTSAIYQIG